MPTCNIILQAQALFNLFGNDKKRKEKHDCKSSENEKHVMNLESWNWLVGNESVRNSKADTTLANPQTSSTVRNNLMKFWCWCREKEKLRSPEKICDEILFLLNFSGESASPKTNVLYRSFSTFLDLSRFADSWPIFPKLIYYWISFVVNFTTWLSFY